MSFGEQLNDTSPTLSMEKHSKNITLVKHTYSTFYFKHDQI